MIDDILARLKAQEHHEMVFVAKDYTRAQLIADLEAVAKEIEALEVDMSCQLEAAYYDSIEEK